MISVSEALQRVLDLVAPLEFEEVPLTEAAGRVLAVDQIATRDQPPFAASAMDGYAILAADLAVGAKLTVIGEAAAGHRFETAVLPGQAVRVFTGAPMPDGADHVVIQEDVKRVGNEIEISDGFDRSSYVRPSGGDFRVGMTFGSPRILRPTDIALLASMNKACLKVTRRPEIAILATGDELVPPGGHPSPDQIIASNSYGLKAMIEAQGARARLLPIARDTEAALIDAFELAASADLIVTIGGASVGDHDLVAPTAAKLGMEQAFYKVAMRPGKPLMAGRIGKTPMLGLPGNPVSAMVCGHVFLKPLIDKMVGLPAEETPTKTATLSRDLGPNGPRAHYMRAHLKGTNIAPFERQDSSLMSVLAEANALLIRPPSDPARVQGENVTYIPL